MADTEREFNLKDGRLVPANTSTSLIPASPSTQKGISKSRQMRTVKILVAFQVEGQEDEVEYVETTAQFFHNGFAYVVTGGGLPHAEHYNLDQAALDWLRIGLLQWGSDFLKKR